MPGKIVIVEGIDRVGKTTLCRKLEKLGFFYFKDSWNILEKDPEINQDSQQLPIKNFEYISLGKLDTSLSMLKLLAAKGVNVVVDRLQISELVYGIMSRGVCLAHLVKRLDKMLAELDCMIIHVRPTSYREATLRAGYASHDYDMAFINFINQCSIGEVRTTYFNDTKILDEVVHFTFSHDFYFASPFFSPEQIEREELLKSKLRSLGFKVFSPKEACHLANDACIADRDKVFNDNLQAIKSSLAVFSVTDGKDVGTIWESGYAFGLDKPIVYYADSLNGRPFNVMLAQSGKNVFTSHSQLTREALINSIIGQAKEFKGLIE